MTTNHTELCERLRQASVQCSDCGMYETSSDFDLAVSMIESQAARIQQQALEYVSLFDQCSEHLARIADLEKERDALRSCVKDALAQCVFDMATDEDPLADRMRSALQAEKETR